jgi:hypothetical protein
MDPANERQQSQPEEPRFLNFPCLPDDAKDAQGNPRLNKYSSTITHGHDFPGAQVRYDHILTAKASILTSLDRQCSMQLVCLIDTQCKLPLK